MSLETRIRDLAIRIATEFNTVEGQIGDLPSLSTTDKTNLVAAINEVFTNAGNAATINDAVTNATNAWSSQKIATEIAAAITNLVDGAPTALDTLNELAAALTDNDSDIAAITTALDNRVRFDIATQGLNATQQANAQTNINVVSADDIGDFDRDFVADFTGALT